MTDNLRSASRIRADESFHSALFFWRFRIDRCGLQFPRAPLLAAAL